LNFFGSINLISSILVTLSSVCLGCARLEYVGEFLKNKLPNQYGVGGDINMVPMTPTPETKY
jgi:hypothetical protein